MEESKVHLVDDIDIVTEELEDLSVNHQHSEEHPLEDEVENRALLDSEGKPDRSVSPSPKEKVDSDTSHTKVIHRVFCVFLFIE